MTKFLNEEMHTLGSVSNMNAEAKARELTDVELVRSPVASRCQIPRRVVSTI